MFTTPNVNSVNGTPVPALTPGSYNATWVITDLNGDTRTVLTRFVEQSGGKGSGGSGRHFKLVIRCQLKRHHVIKCQVTFKKSSTDARQGAGPAARPRQAGDRSGPRIGQGGQGDRDDA